MSVSAGDVWSRNIRESHQKKLGRYDIQKSMKIDFEKGAP